MNQARLSTQDKRGSFSDLSAGDEAVGFQHLKVFLKKGRHSLIQLKESNEKAL